MSNSAANEWCASAGAARAASVTASAAEMKVCVRDIGSPRIDDVGILLPNLPAAGRPRRIPGLELAVEQRLGELHAIELEQARVGFGAPIERHADRPGLGERLRILDRRL